MGYDVSYKGRDDREAVLDLVQYPGFHRALLLRRAANAPKVTFEMFEVYCSFCGVRGYPVKAAWNRWRPKKLSHG